MTWNEVLLFVFVIVIAATAIDFIISTIMEEVEKIRTKHTTVWSIMELRACSGLFYITPDQTDNNIVRGRCKTFREALEFKEYLSRQYELENKNANV